MNTVYTIGYSGFVFADFIKTLKTNRISLLVDVRSLPYSQYYTGYNKENLQNALKLNCIHYRNYANEFGARQKNSKWQSIGGYLDFEIFAQSSQFLAGYNKLVKSMIEDYKIVLMCAEKDPMDCHRAILVSRIFYQAGYNIVHLLPGGKQMSQKDVESRLLDKYFPNRYQVTMFDNQSIEQYINDAYRKRNADIGYSITEGKL